MKQKICPVCELSINENIITCPQCEWDFTDVLGTPEKSGVKLQQKLAKAKTAWNNRIQIKPVTNLQSHIQGNELLLTWDWHSDIDKVRVCLRYDEFPSSENDPSAKTFDVSKVEYDRTGYSRVPHHITKRIHYFSVYAKSAKGDFSLPTRIKERAGLFYEVNYRVIKEKRFFLFQTIAIKIRVKGASSLGLLKNLSLIGNSEHLPTSINDGVTLLKIDNIDLNQNGIADIFVPKQYWNEKYFVRLFFRKNEDAEEIHLIHSALENMRLG